MPTSSHSATLRHGLPGTRGGSLGLARAGLLLISSLPKLYSYPTKRDNVEITEEGESPESASFWVNFSVAFVLVVLGGIFAGLTLG